VLKDELEVPNVLLFISILSFLLDVMPRALVCFWQAHFKWHDFVSVFYFN